MLKNILVVFVISVFAAAACVKSQVETQTTTNDPSSQQNAAVIPQTDADKLTSDNAVKNSKTFRGAISDSKFEMNLVRNGKNLSGTYFYTKVGKKLNLAGKIDKAGNFTLQETDEQGGKTGEWKGTWKEDENSSGVVLEGDWKKPNGGETLGFYATQQIIEFTGDAKFTDKTVKESDKSKRSDIYAVYPEISGIDSAVAAKFNSTVKNIITDLNKSYKQQIAEYTSEDIKNLPEYAQLSNDVSYDVVLANDDYISLIFSDYVYLGGAHGNTIFSTLNYDLKNNREIKFTELFVPKSDYLKKISEYSIASLKKQVGELSGDEIINEGAGANADNFQNWNLAKKGLMFTFNPYQVAAYAAGSPSVIIPYNNLNDILQKDGIAAKLGK